MLHIFWIFLRLGFTSFGGPIAHLGFFRDEFVRKRLWLSEEDYADLVALCQMLPGPASSQLGMALGYFRGGHKGALAAWLGFTAPSAVAMILVAMGVAQAGDALPQGLLHGLKVVAVAVVAQALWGMGKKLCPDPMRVLWMALAATLVIWFHGTWIQILVIVMGAMAGWLWVPMPKVNSESRRIALNLNSTFGVVLLALFFLLLGILPVFENWTSYPLLQVFNAFYRSGSLVFGGGHVVLPLLQAELVDTGWLSENTFLAGYGAAQAVPGPLFTFAAFLGASLNQGLSGWLGGIFALVAIFAPAYLLIIGALPFWNRIRTHQKAQSALAGVNATVVGILLAAFYQPVWTSAIFHGKDFVLAVLAFVALESLKVPAWLVVILGALTASIIY